MRTTTTQEIYKTLNNIQSPQELLKKKRELSNEKYEKFVKKKVQLKDTAYNGCEQMQPLVYFYKLLAKKVEYNNKDQNRFRCKIWLPDTIVFNDGDGPMWFYSGLDGYVYRQDSFNEKNIVSKLCSYTSADELVAVLKKPEYLDSDAGRSNIIQLLPTKEMSQTVSGLIRSKGEIGVLQKFIKSNGPKAFIVRTIWRIPKLGGHEAYILTSKHDFYVEDINIEDRFKFIANPSHKKHCTIVYTRNGKHIHQTIPYLQNIVNFIQNNSNVRFQELIGDFIKDECGTYWLVSIKAFRLFNQDQLDINLRRITHAGEVDLDHQENIQLLSKKTNITEDEYKKFQRCKYCECKMIDSAHRMTIKMIIQTDQALLKRGKNFDFLNRYKQKNIDLINLYEEHKVCKMCYKLYKETEKFLEVEYEINRVLGIPVTQDTKYELLELSTQDINEPSFKEKLKKKYDTGNRTQPFFNEIEVHDTEYNLNEIYEGGINMYRMMVLFNKLVEIPDYIEISLNYSIQYTLFNQKHKINLDFSQAQEDSNKKLFIQLNKIRVFYFFARSRKQVRDFINQQKSITVKLFCENKEYGTVDFELSDFLSDNVIKREFFKYFSQKTLENNTLYWGLSISIGMNDEKQMMNKNIPLEKHLGNIENCDFRQEDQQETQDSPEDKTNQIQKKSQQHYHNGIYLTIPDYYIGKPLDSEWIYLFDKKKDNTIININNNNNTMKNKQMIQTTSDLFKYSQSNFNTKNFSNSKSVKKIDVQNIQQNNMLEDGIKSQQYLIENEKLHQQQDSDLSQTIELFRQLDKDLEGYNKAYQNDRTQHKKIKRKIYYL